jgi:hypothetical protein
MTTFLEPTVNTPNYEKKVMKSKSKGRIFVKWATSTDHNTIGYL